MAAPVLSNQSLPNGARLSTNGRYYVKDEAGGWKEVGKVSGYTAAELDEAARGGAFRQQGTSLDGYLDEVAGLSGLGKKNVSGSQGGSGKGIDGDGQDSEGSGDIDNDEEAGNAAVKNGLSLEQIAAGAAGGALTAWAISKLKGKKGAQSTAASPATDTAGAADKGGPGGGADTVKSTDLVKGAYPEGDTLDPPERAISSEQDMARRNGVPYADYTEVINDPRLLDSPNPADLPPVQAASAGQMKAGPQSALPSPRDPDAQAWLDDIMQKVQGSSVVDESIQAVEGPNAPMVDPEMEAALKGYAEQLRAKNGGTLDGFDVKNAMNPSLNPEAPNMDPTIMNALKRILAGMT